MLLRILCVLMLLALGLAALGAPAFDDGQPRRYSRVFTLKEQLEQTYRNELVTYAVEFPKGQARVASLRLWDDTRNQSISFQLSNAIERKGILARADISFWVDALDAGETRTYTLWWDASRKYAPAPFPPAALTETVRPDGTVEIVGKQYGLRFAGTTTFRPPLPCCQARGPLQAFKGADGVWRGSGSFQAGVPLARQTFTTVENGPLWRTCVVRTDFTNGDWHELRAQLFPDTDYARFSESSSYRGEVESFRRGEQFLGELPPAEYGTVKPLGQCVFSLRENFDPDTDYTPSVFTRNLDTFNLPHGDLKATTLSWHIHPYWHKAWGALYSSDPAIHDCLGVFTTDAEHWSPAVSPLLLLDDAAGHARISMPMNGNRHYYFVFSTREQVVQSAEAVAATKRPSHIRYWMTKMGGSDRITPAACLVWQRRTRLTDFPLNKVKDWVLDYDVMQDVHPRVLWDPADQKLDEIQRRFAQVPEFSKYYKEGQVIDYLFTGKHGPNYPPEPDGIRRDWDFCGIENYVRDVLELGNGANIYIYSTGNYSRESMLLADGYLDQLTPAERKNWVRWVLAALYVAGDWDHWKYQGEGILLANFNDIGFSAMGVGAAFFPRHPMAKYWAARAMSGGQFVLDTTISPDGVGLENIGNYHPFSWNLWVKNAIALNRAGYPSIANDPKFKRTVMYMIEQMTPRDPGMSNDRMLPPVGHHPGAGMRRFGEFHWGVQLWAKSDPKLASYCQWAWEQNGRAMGGLSRPLPLNLLLGKLDYPSRQPPLPSMAWDNAGWVFRSHVGEPKESYFLMKCGAERGHHHGDEGSFHMYGKGVLLAGDGYDLRSDAQQQFEHCFLSFGNPQTDGLPAGTWRRFATTAAVDYGIGTIPSGTKQSSYDREVLFLKSKDVERPEYFVMLDRTTGPETPRFDFDVQSTKPTANFNDDPRWINFPGIDLPGYRVGLDVIFLLNPPLAATATNRTTPACNLTAASIDLPDMPPQPVFRKGETYAAYLGVWNVKEHWIMSVPGAPGCKFATIMYPRPYGWPTPKVTTLAAGVTLVEHQNGKDYIFLGKQPFTYDAGDIHFAGRVGVVRDMPGERSLTLIEGTRLMYGGQTVTKPVPAREQ